MAKQTVTMEPAPQEQTEAAEQEQPRPAPVSPYAQSLLPQMERTLALVAQERAVLSNALLQIGERIERLLTLTSVSPDTLTVSECVAQSGEIAKTRQELFTWLTYLPPAIANEWSNPVLYTEDAAKPFEKKVKAAREVEKAEEARQARAAYVAREEAFEEELKKRRRSGEALVMEREWRRFRQQNPSPAEQGQVSDLLDPVDAMML